MQSNSIIAWLRRHAMLFAVAVFLYVATILSAEAVVDGASLIEASQQRMSTSKLITPHERQISSSVLRDVCSSAILEKIGEDVMVQNTCQHDEQEFSLENDMVWIAPLWPYSEQPAF